jgi:hypothetical protein
METLSEIERIIDEIPDKYPTIIYMGVGTHFCGYNFRSCERYSIEAKKSEEWDYNLNQQYPVFIDRIKQMNRNIKIKIILIDPAFKEVREPYIIRDENSYLKGTFRRISENNYYSERYDVDVYYYSEYITWDSTTYREGYNITDYMCKYIDMITKKNAILTYHEYVGRDVYEFRKILRNKCYNYDDNKICIDITNGRNLACYIDLSEVENIPIIKLDKYNKLRYINPDEITIEEKKYYVNKGKDENDKNSDEYIMYKQIESIIKCRLKEIKDYVVPLKRLVKMEINEEMIRYYLRKVNELMLKESSEMMYNINYYIDIYIKFKKEEDREALEENIMMLIKTIITKYNYIWTITTEKNINEMMEEMKKADKYKMTEIYNNFYKKYIE